MAKKKTNAEEKGEKSEALKLVLLDSHAILHRAYHALPDFTSSKGEPTGALYGLILMLLKIVDDIKPDYIVATRDLPGKTHRHEAFEAYKATRMKADEALVVQLQSAPKVFEAFGIPVYAYPGFEADDMLGTIAREISARSDLRTIIASGDMDTLQLVGPRVSVYTMRKGISDTVLYDEAGVEARYGFGPGRVVDYKALRGDPSDNIPGVKGIGEKTATDLIKEFGSLDNVYKALEKDPEAFAKKTKPRIAQLLKDGKANAAFSKSLATIRTDAPIQFELPKRPWHLTDHGASIATLLDELEFRALKQRLKLGNAEAEISTEQAAAAGTVDKYALTETSVALWLLHSDTSNPSLEDVLAYAHTDDFERAREKIFADLRATGHLNDVYEKIEKPLIPIVERMHEIGIFLDTKYLEKLAKEYNKELGELAARIYKVAGHEFNINSPKQLGAVLYDELKISSGGKQKKTATGARTTREDELAKMAEGNPVVADVLAYRELQKLLGTYIEKMPALVGEDKRLHAEFIQAGTTTGRMSSQNPNLQNIPVKTEYGRRIREAFAAQKGYVIVAIDYSQIELRIAAALSGDEKLVEIFKRGQDVHAATAAQVFNVPPEHVDKEMRRRAKVINFGILYGMGVNALRANLGEGISREESATYLSEYFKNFAGLSRYVENQKRLAKERGYTETLFGRRRYFPGFKSTLPGVVAQAERMAVNAPIQGTQSDIIKLAMAEADRMIEKNGWRDKARLLLQVHDELVYEIEEKESEHIAREICNVMESVAPAEKLSGVPIVAEIAIGKNWGSTERLKK